MSRIGSPDRNKFVSQEDELKVVKRYEVVKNINVTAIMSNLSSRLVVRILKKHNVNTRRRKFISI